MLELVVYGCSRFRGIMRDIGVADGVVHEHLGARWGGRFRLVFLRVGWLYYSSLSGRHPVEYFWYVFSL